MPITPVRNVGAAGIISDIPSVLLPPQAWSDGRNVRFDNLSVSKMLGHVSVLETGATNPEFLEYWPRPNRQYYIYGDAETVYRVDQEDTIETIGSGFNAGGKWHTSLFNGGYSVVLNNTLETPQFINYDPLGGTETLNELPGWNYNDDFTVTAGVVRSFGNVLVAGNLTTVTPRNSAGQTMTAWIAAGAGTWIECNIQFRTSTSQVAPEITITNCMTFTSETSTPGTVADGVVLPVGTRFVVQDESQHIYANLVLRDPVTITAGSSPTLTLFTEIGGEVQKLSTVMEFELPTGRIAVPATNTAANFVADSAQEIVQNLPSTMRVSTRAAPGGFPQVWQPGLLGTTSTADEFELATSDPIVDILAISRDQAIVYTTTTMWSLQVTSSATIVRQLSSTYGARRINCVSSFENQHFVVGVNDVYTHSGSGGIQSVIDQKHRDYLLMNLHPVFSDNIFIQLNSQQDEMWVCFPNLAASAVNGNCNEALIYNYKQDTWTKRDLPGILDASEGPITGGGIPSYRVLVDGEITLTSNYVLNDNTPIGTVGAGYVSEFDGLPTIQTITIDEDAELVTGTTVGTPEVQTLYGSGTTVNDMAGIVENTNEVYELFINQEFSSGETSAGIAGGFNFQINSVDGVGGVPDELRAGRFRLTNFSGLSASSSIEDIVDWVVDDARTWTDSVSQLSPVVPVVEKIDASTFRISVPDGVFLYSSSGSFRLEGNGINTFANITITDINDSDNTSTGTSFIVISDSGADPEVPTSFVLDLDTSNAVFQGTISYQSNDNETSTQALLGIRDAVIASEPSITSSDILAISAAPIDISIDISDYNITYPYTTSDGAGFFDPDNTVRVQVTYGEGFGAPTFVIVSLPLGVTYNSDEEVAAGLVAAEPTESQATLSNNGSILRMSSNVVTADTIRVSVGVNAAGSNVSFTDNNSGEIRPSEGGTSGNLATHSIRLDTNQLQNIDGTVMVTVGAGTNVDVTLDSSFQDGAAMVFNSTITLRDESGTEVISISRGGGASLSDILAELKGFVDSNTETPIDFQADVSGNNLVMTAQEAGYIYDTWTIDVDHHGGDGNIAFDNGSGFAGIAERTTIGFPVQNSPVLRFVLPDMVTTSDGQQVLNQVFELFPSETSRVIKDADMIATELRSALSTLIGWDVSGSDRDIILTSADYTANNNNLAANRIVDNLFDITIDTGLSRSTLSDFNGTSIAFEPSSSTDDFWGRDGYDVDSSANGSTPEGGNVFYREVPSANAYSIVWKGATVVTSTDPIQFPHTVDGTTYYIGNRFGDLSSSSIITYAIRREVAAQTLIAETQEGTPNYNLGTSSIFRATLGTIQRDFEFSEGETVAEVTTVIHNWFNTDLANIFGTGNIEDDTVDTSLTDTARAFTATLSNFSILDLLTIEQTQEGRIGFKDTDDTSGDLPNSTIVSTLSIDRGFNNQVLDPLRPWPQTEFNDSRRFFVMSGTRDSKLYGADISYQFDGVNFKSYIEKKSLDMGSLEASKWTSSIYPLVDGEGSVTVKAIASNAFGNEVNFDNPNYEGLFDISNDYKIDTRVNGRFASFRFETEDANHWRLAGYSLSTADSTQKR